MNIVNVVLCSPGGGAGLGSLGTTAAANHRRRPRLLRRPRSRGLTWTGTSRSITSVNLSFTAPLDPTYALNPADYQLDRPRGRATGHSAHSASYNPRRYSVTLVPSVPLPSGQYYQIQSSAGPTAIRDIAGNLLDGAANGLAGSNYVASSRRATTQVCR